MMYPQLPPQHLMAGSGMPPGYPQPMGGAQPGVYVSMFPPPPPQQLPAHMSLARFPGEALHSMPPGDMVPLQHAGNAGRPSGLLASAHTMLPGGMHMVGPSGMPMAAAMGAGGMLPHGFPQQYGMPQLAHGHHMPAMGHHQQLPAHIGTGRGPSGGTRSGQVTPKGGPGSGSSTPLHPLRRSLSSGQALPPGYYVPARTHSASFTQAPPTMQPPPGIVLPDSLSPASPQALYPAGVSGSPGSRAQLGVLAGPMQPLPSGPPLQLRSRIPRVGGGGSLRSSVDYSGGDRTPGGVHSSGLPKPPSAGSRAGSAGRRAGLVPAPAAELDELDNIKVAVRVRPPNAQELARGDCQAVFVNQADFRQVQVAVPGGPTRASQSTTRNFTFHACLGPTSRQQDVLRLCGITQLLDAAMDGYNATVMCYGQTGSGKTYTMSGHVEALFADGGGGDSDDGILARSLAHLFEQVHARSAAPDAGARFSLRVSVAEIYCEAVYDLVHFSKKQLQVRWDSGKGFYVPDLACKECATLEEAKQVLSLAARHRRVGSHEMNLESSRSHSITTVYVDCTPTRSDDHEFGVTRYGKVSFVDLAGSERVKDSKSAGETLKETANINRSLFMLGKVIAALADGAQGARVPYRESKLTKLLMDSLGGSSLSLLIACCSPSAAHIEETLSTLGYAARAKNIRNRPAVQVDPGQAALSELKRELRLLRGENAYLRDQLLLAGLPRGAPGPAPALHPPHSGHGPLHGTPGHPAGRESQVQAGESLTRPGSGAGAAPDAPAGGGPSPEELMRRLLDTQRLLVQFSRENDRLAGENGRLRSGRALVADSYQGALEEVDWLRGKLESLETALRSGSLDSQALAGLAAGEGGPGVLDAALAAVAGAGEGEEAGGWLLVPGGIAAREELGGMAAEAGAVSGFGPPPALSADGDAAVAASTSSTHQAAAAEDSPAEVLNNIAWVAPTAAADAMPEAAEKEPGSSMADPAVLLEGSSSRGSEASAHEPTAAALVTAEAAESHGGSGQQVELGPATSALAAPSAEQ